MDQPGRPACSAYEPEELVGRLGSEICHPDDYERVYKQFVDMLGDPPRDSLRTESRSLHKDGSWVWVESIIHNKLDDPAVRGIVTNFRDISARIETEHALRDSEARYRSVAGASPIGIYEMDEAPAAFRERALAGDHRLRCRRGARAQLAEIIHPDDRAVMAEQWASSGARPAVPGHGARRASRRRGAVGHVGHRAAVRRARHADRARRHARRHHRAPDGPARHRAPVGHRRGDERPGGDLRSGQPSALHERGRSTVLRPLGPTHRSATSTSRRSPRSGPRSAILNETRPALREHGIWSGEFAYFHDGFEVSVSALFLAHHDGDGNIEFVSSVTRDISERKAFEQRLEYQATHDPLTGLPNRTLFLDRLELALARRRRRSNRPVAVLFCDVDHFKVVNDSLGHGAGDRLLVALAERLRDALRPGDTVARFGGDEFVILCDELVTEHDAVAIAERANRAVHEPLTVESTEVFAAMSIGIAFANADTEPEAMIRDADAAMYLAKERGRARYEIYDERMRSTLVERLDIETALRRALTRHELRVVYQPTINLESGLIVGVEALLRWEHPERGPLVPSEFIDVAEETGLIVPIGMWVVEQACRQAQRWQAARADDEPMFVSVNLSGRQLDTAALVDNVADILQRTGLEPSLLGLEITESVVMRDPEASTTPSARSRISVCGSPSTTSARATRRSPISAASRSSCSRSTARSSTASTRRRATPRTERSSPPW